MKRFGLPLTLLIVGLLLFKGTHRQDVTRYAAYRSITIDGSALPPVDKLFGIIPIRRIEKNFPVAVPVSMASGEPAFPADVKFFSDKLCLHMLKEQKWNWGNEPPMRMPEVALFEGTNTVFYACVPRAPQ